MKLGTSPFHVYTLDVLSQITNLYSKQDLVGKQVMVVTNLSPKKIGPFISECLVTGFYLSKESVVLATSDQKVPNGLLLV